MFTGLVPIGQALHAFTAATTPSECRPHARVTIRESGRATYRERNYTVVLEDEHRFPRLVQSVREEMVLTDPRLKTNEVVLVDPEHHRDITSQKALDHVLRSRTHASLAYRVHEKRAPAPFVSLPPAPSIEIKRPSTAATSSAAARLEATITSEQRRANEVNRLREVISSSMAEAIAASRATPFHDHARSVMSRHRASLTLLGARHPSALANQIAFDIAATAANADTRLMTPANCHEIYRLRLMESPVWAAINDAITEQLADETPTTARPAPTTTTTTAPLVPAREYDYTVKAPPMNLSLFVFNSGVTPLPTAKKSPPAPAAAAAAASKQKDEPFTVDESDVDAFSSVGFKSFTTSASVGDEPVVFRPFGAAPKAAAIGCDSCARKGKPTKEARRTMVRVRVTNDLAPRDLRVFCDNVELGTVPYREAVLLPGSRSYWVVAGRHAFTFRDAGSQKVYTPRENITFRAGGRYWIFLNRLHESGHLKPDFTESPLTALTAAQVGAPIATTTTTTASPMATIRATVPAGHSIALVDAKSGRVAAVGTQFVDVEAGSKRVRVTSPDGRVKELPDTVLLHPSTRRSFELACHPATGRYSWRLVGDGDASAAYTTQLAARPTPVDGELVLLHEDGAVALAPNGVISFDTHTGDEVEIKTRDKKLYIFDADRRKAFDAENKPLDVKAVFDHPRNPRAKVVVLPKATNGIQEADA
jgi:hypothetical protein